MPLDPFLSTSPTPGLDITVKYPGLNPGLNPVSFVQIQGVTDPLTPVNPAVSFDVVVPGAFVTVGNSIHPGIGTSAGTSCQVELWQNGVMLSLTDVRGVNPVATSYPLLIAIGKIVAMSEVAFI